MTVYIDDPDFTLHLGDVRDVLPTLEAESVDCAVTSPPFYALRDYGTGEWEGGDEGCDHLKVSDVEAAVATSTLGGGKKTTGHLQEGYGSECGKCGARRIDRQIGLEATPDEWAAELVGVFREVRRVLKPEGTLWVECGDSYSSSPPGNKGTPDEAYKSSGLAGAVAGSRRMETLAKRVGQKRDTSRIPGIKPKDLIGAPWLLAFALRADGWYLRQAIIWHKPNAMPESVRDRCTTAHSYVFLLSKQPRYWFDADAIAEPAEWARWGDQTVAKYEGTETASGWMQPKTREQLAAISRPQTRRAWELFEQHGLTEAHLDAIRACGVSDTGKALVTTNGAGYNLEAVQRLADEAKDVLGGYYREFLMTATRTGSKNARSVWTIPTSGYAEAHFATFPEALVERMLLAGCPEGGVVLDPFMGSGTNALVARRLGRRAVGVELNAEYAAMAARRLQQLSLLA